MKYERPDLKVERFSIMDSIAATEVLSSHDFPNTYGIIDESNNGSDDPNKPVIEEVFDTVFNIF
ncbi:MAG: hypothetical protein IJU45_02175 [Clostridia bacterium]|nr:hypothetical protein [Clostridia bacterium]